MGEGMVGSGGGSTELGRAPRGLTIRKFWKYKTEVDQETSVKRLSSNENRSPEALLMTPLEGGCVCGQVRYRITRPISTVAVCHCRRCQGFAGGGPNYSVIVPRGGFEIVEGTPRPVKLKADRGMRVDRMFCGDCGTQLYSDTADRPYTPVRLGTLDDPSPWKPAFHMWVEAAPSWHAIDETLPRYAKAPN